MTVYYGVCVFVPLRLVKSPVEPLDCALCMSNIWESAWLQSPHNRQVLSLDYIIC